MTRRKDNKNRVLKEGENQRSNGTYEYKYHDICGTRRSVYAKTLEELRIKEAEIAKNKLDGINDRGKTLTVNDLFDSWFAIKHNLRDSSLSIYKGIYNKHIKNDIGRLKVSSVKKNNIRDFYIRLQRDKGLQKSTITNVRNILLQAFEMALEDSVVKINPVIGAHKNVWNPCDERPHHKSALTVEQQQELEEFAKGSKFKYRWPIIQFLLWTGLRIGEAGGLTWDDIDFEKNFIHIRRTLANVSKNGDVKHELRIHNPKTNTGIRDVPIMPQAREALLWEKRNQQASGISCKDTIGGYSNFVFLNRSGHVMRAGAVNCYLKTLVRAYNKNLPVGKAPLPNITNHTFRHTFSTRLNEMNINMRAIQAILGHASVQTTMNIYTDVSTEFLADQLSLLKTR